MIEASRYDAGTAYVVVDNHRQDDAKPYLYKTTDFGATWQRLDSSLPPDIYLHAIREDSKDKNILYLGTERGLAFSTDGGKSWKGLKSNLPTVAVHDLAVKDNSLVLATLGRSIWSFDNLSAIRELNAINKDAAVHLFTVPDTIRWRYAGSVGEKFSGENPPNGALIYYWLKEEPKSDISIEILDSTNTVIATLSSKPRTPIGFGDSLEAEARAFGEDALPKAAGVNRAVWNLAYKGAELIENGKLDFGGPVFGPMAIPGSYTVRLSLDGKQFTSKLNLLHDPRVQISETDYKAQLATALAIRDDVTRLTLTVRQIRSVRQQLKARNELLNGDAKAAQLVKDSEAMIKKLDELEKKIHNPEAEVVYDILAFRGGAKLYSRIASLHDQAADGDGPPTQGVRDVYAEQKKELDGYDSEMKKLLGEMAAMNVMAKKLDLPHVIVPETGQLVSGK